LTFFERARCLSIIEPRTNDNHLEKVYSVRKRGLGSSMGEVERFRKGISETKFEQECGRCCFLVNVFSALVAGFNVAITFGLVVYSLRTKGVYKGEKFRRSMSGFTRSAMFFLFAAMLRVSLIWDIMPDYLEPLEIGVRSVAFLLLFKFSMEHFRDWKKFHDEARRVTW
jgi:hypothetical protein